MACCRSWGQVRVQVLVHRHGPSCQVVDLHRSCWVGKGLGQRRRHLEERSGSGLEHQGELEPLIQLAVASQAALDKEIGLDLPDQKEGNGNLDIIFCAFPM